MAELKDNHYSTCNLYTIYAYTRARRGGANRDFYFSNVADDACVMIKLRRENQPSISYPLPTLFSLMEQNRKPPHTTYSAILELCRAVPPVSHHLPGTHSRPTDYEGVKGGAPKEFFPADLVYRYRFADNRRIKLFWGTLDALIIRRYT